MLIGGSPRVFVIYALVPWFAVLLLGYCAGPLFQKERAERRHALLRLGALTTGAFLVLRWFDFYGDPTSLADSLRSVTEAERSSLAMAVVAFLNVTKYPPSLLYLAMTLGPAFLFLALADRAPGRVGRALVNFGRVPLFYYVAHIFLIHLGIRFYNLVVYGEFLSPLQAVFSGNTPEWFGNGLGLVYVAWLLTVLLLYPLCAWFGALKRRGRSALWSYL